MSLTSIRMHPFKLLLLSHAAGSMCGDSPGAGTLVPATLDLQHGSRTMPRPQRQTPSTPYHDPASDNCLQPTDRSAHLGPPSDDMSSVVGR